MYLLLALALFCFQGRLLFFQQKIGDVAVEQIRHDRPDVEEIQLKTPDKTMIRGWLLKRTMSKRAALIIYFGGNAEEVSSLIYDFDRFKNCSLLLMNYRGYGLSEGTPNERNLYNDAVFIYDHFSRRPDVDGSNIILMGRSLGTGVAVDLATKRRVKGLILVTPYDSMVSVAQEKYGLFPITLMMLNRFDSISKAPKIHRPMLTLIAGDDEVIPPRHARLLVSRWGGKANSVLIDGAGHNNIQESQAYWSNIEKFLEDIIK